MNLRRAEDEHEIRPRRARLCQVLALGDRAVLDNDARAALVRRVDDQLLAREQVAVVVRQVVVDLRPGHRVREGRHRAPVVQPVRVPGHLERHARRLVVDRRLVRLLRGHRLHGADARVDRPEVVVGLAVVEDPGLAGGGAGKGSQSGGSDSEEDAEEAHVD